MKEKQGKRGSSKRKRSFHEIRDSILFQLSFGRKTVNQIADEINANWKTVDLHIIFLKGKGMIDEVFKSDYVRIYELSSDGKKYVAMINPALAEAVETEKEIEKAEQKEVHKTDYVG